MVSSWELVKENIGFICCMYKSINFYNFAISFCNIFQSSFKVRGRMLLFYNLNLLGV